MLGTTTQEPRRPVEETVSAPWVHRPLRTFKEAKEQWLGRFERDYIRAMLEKHGYKIAPAAREAGLDRKYFRQLARKYGLIQGGKTEDGK